jgi:hypothetical protein
MTDTDHGDAHRAPEDVADSLRLSGAVALGTGVMIGAGIFAITGQTAALTGDLFPIAFLVAAAVVAVSAYSHVKLSNAFPSWGGIAMFLKEAPSPRWRRECEGEGSAAAGCARGGQHAVVGDGQLRGDREADA